MTFALPHCKCHLVAVRENKASLQNKLRQARQQHQLPAALSQLAASAPHSLQPSPAPISNTSKQADDIQSASKLPRTPAPESMGLQQQQQGGPSVSQKLGDTEATSVVQTPLSQATSSTTPVQSCSTRDKLAADPGSASAATSIIANFVKNCNW